MSRFIKKISIFIFIFTLIYFPLYYFSNSYHVRDLSIYQFLVKQNKIKTGKPYENIILGDSRALAINFFPDTPVGDVYNYSFANAGGMYPYVYFFKKYLQVQDKPEKILWSFIPLMLTDQWEIFKTPPPVKSAELFRSSKLYSVFDMIIPAANNIFYKYPQTTGSLLYRKVSIDAASILKYFAQPYRVDDNEKMLNKATGGLLYSLDRQWQYTPDNYLENVKFNISDRSILFIQQFLNLAKKHSIKVYLFNMPIPDTISQKRKDSGFYTKYLNCMTELEQKYPETLFIYREVLSYPDSYFSDGSHLNSTGAHWFQNNDYGRIKIWVDHSD